MREAYGTLEVAGVCDVDNGQDRMRFVIGTQPTVIWTLLHCLGSWVKHAFADFAVFFKPVVCFYVSPIHVFKVSMLGAVFDY